MMPQICEALLSTLVFSLAAKGYSFGFPGCNNTGVSILKMALKFTLLIVCCLSNQTYADHSPCKGGTIIPPDPYFLLGQTINITCNSHREKKRTASKMSFKYNVTLLRNVTKEQVNETAIRLIGQVLIGHIRAIKNRVAVQCLYKDKCLDMALMKLDYYPLEAQNVTCRIYNWDTMTCRWSIGVVYKYQDDISVSCRYTTSNNPGFNASTRAEYRVFGKFAVCPNQTNTSCHWDEDNLTTPLAYVIKVIVTNNKLNVSVPKEWIFHKYDIIEPGPVTDLEVVLTDNVSCVNVSWVPVKPTRSFVYNLTWDSNCSEPGNKTLNYTDRSRQVSTTVCGLNPNTLYTFTVTGRLFKSFPRGYWSKPVTVNQSTKTSAPKSSPLTTEGLYEILYTRQSTVKIYWVPLSRCDMHSEHVTYTASWFNDNIYSKSTDHPEFSTKLHLIPNSHLIKIHSSNKDGQSDTASTILVHRGDAAVKPSELVIWYSQCNGCCNYVKASFLPDHQGNKDFRNISHTLVWCIGDSYCKEQIQWKVLPPNQMSVKLPLQHCHDKYLFGLITHGHHHGNHSDVTDTGIQWTFCTYQVGKAPNEPLKNVHLSPKQPSDGFTVQWDKYNCRLGVYITHYQLNYYISTSLPCTRNQSKYSSVNVSRHENGKTVNGLENGNQYCIWVTAVNKAGTGPSTGPILQYTIGEGTDVVSHLPIWSIVVFIIVALLLCFILFKILCHRYSKCIDKKKKSVEIGNILKLQDLDNLEPDNIPKVSWMSPEEEYLLNNKDRDSGNGSDEQNPTAYASPSEIDVYASTYEEDTVHNPNRLSYEGYSEEQEALQNHGNSDEAFGSRTTDPNDTGIPDHFTAGHSSGDHSDTIEMSRNNFNEINERKLNLNADEADQPNNTEEIQDVKLQGNIQIDPYMLYDGKDFKPRETVRNHAEDEDTNSLNDILSEHGGSTFGSIGVLHDDKTNIEIPAESHHIVSDHDENFDSDSDMFGYSESEKLDGYQKYEFLDTDDSSEDEPNESDKMTEDTNGNIGIDFKGLMEPATFIDMSEDEPDEGDKMMENTDGNTGKGFNGSVEPGNFIDMSKDDICKGILDSIHAEMQLDNCDEIETENDGTCALSGKFYNGDRTSLEMVCRSIDQTLSDESVITLNREDLNGSINNIKEANVNPKTSANSEHDPDSDNWDCYDKNYQAEKEDHYKSSLDLDFSDKDIDEENNGHFEKDIQTSDYPENTDIVQINEKVKPASMERKETLNKSDVDELQSVLNSELNLTDKNVEQSSGTHVTGYADEKYEHFDKSALSEQSDKRDEQTNKTCVSSQGSTCDSIEPYQTVTDTLELKAADKVKDSPTDIKKELHMSYQNKIQCKV